MTATLDRPTTEPAPSRRGFLRAVRTWLRQPRWRRFTAAQLAVLGAATVAPVMIVGLLVAGTTGLMSIEAMIELALAAGEEPGMFVFAAMFLASPVQWLTGRTQVRVRKYLGIVFFLLALSNGAMFVIETGVGAAFSAPFLVAGSLALLLSVPLFLTSSRWSQRALGLRRWRLLHKATYVIAVALLVHVVLIDGPGIAGIVILAGFLARVSPVRRWLERLGKPTAVPAAV